MRAGCAISEQARPLLQHHDSANANQSVAAFLIARGPLAWLGWGWESGSDAQWDPAFDYDVGEPAGACVEEAPGVFSRAWTYGRARLDCGAWTAEIPARNTARTVGSRDTSR
jgi:hypothetical protein